MAESKKAKDDKDKEKAKKDEEKLAKEEKEEKLLVKAAIKRQKENELFEIKQSLSICFGDKIPKKRNELFILKDVTPLHIWMQQPFIYTALKAEKPDEIFHPIEVYALKWTPPRSKYVIMTPLDDPQLQENMLIQMHNMLPSERKRIIFCFGPRNPTMNLYAPKVHPSSLISYRTSDKVLEKLCDIFLEGRLTLAELQNVLAAKYDVWRLTLYNLLSAEEQDFHTYLTTPLESKSKKDIEKMYMDDVITLKEFEDLRFPDRKKRKEIEAMSYPRPYEYGPCVICGNPETGLISCQNCTNLVCRECIHKNFLDGDTKEGSFLLLHRKYCLRLGKLAEPTHVIVGEPSYLRELRSTGKSQAYESACKVYEARIKLEEGDSEEEDDEIDEEQLKKLAAEEERKRLQREAEEKLLRERPPALLEQEEILRGLLKKLAKYEKEVLEHQEKIEEPGHTEMFIQRVCRLKAEVLTKLAANTRPKMEHVSAAITKLNCEGEFAAKCLEDVTMGIMTIDKLTSMTSLAEYKGIPPDEPKEDEGANENKEEALIDEVVNEASAAQEIST